MTPCIKRRESLLAEDHQAANDVTYISPTFPAVELGEAKVEITEDFFSAVVDVRAFAWEEVAVKTVGTASLSVEAEHFDESNNTSRQFRRTFNLPEDANVDHLVSRIGLDGMLNITVPRHDTSKERSHHIDLATPENDLLASKQYMGLVPLPLSLGVKCTKEQFEVNLDMEHFKQDDVSVKATREGLVIEAEHVDSDDESDHYFQRRYTFPCSVNKDKLKWKLNSKGILQVSLPRQAEEATKVESDKTHRKQIVRKQRSVDEVQR